MRSSVMSVRVLYRPLQVVSSAHARHPPGAALREFALEALHLAHLVPGNLLIVKLRKQHHRPATSSKGGGSGGEGGGEG